MKPPKRVEGSRKGRREGGERNEKMHWRLGELIKKRGDKHSSNYMANFGWPMRVERMQEHIKISSSPLKLEEEDLQISPICIYYDVACVSPSPPPPPPLQFVLWGNMQNFA